MGGKLQRDPAPQKAAVVPCLSLLVVTGLSIIGLLVGC
jgi:hypothetical protein